MQIINPATGSVLEEIETDNEGLLSQKLALLREGQKSWADTALSHRLEILTLFSECLLAKRAELAYTLTSEMGKPLQQARNEINGARNRIQWFIENAAQWLAPEIMHQEAGLTEKIVYEPLGVICHISAWNYPYLVGVNVFVPALLAGNAVMYKPSEYATLTGLAIHRLWLQAGLPAEVMQLAIGGPDIGEILLNQDFDGYFFTGSYKTGQYIYKRVAPRMVTCQCELGGKDPLYVTDDIQDITSVVAATADGAFYNNGQSCCAVERIYVHEKIYQDYVSAFMKEVKSWKTGSPLEPDTYIGPLSRESQLAVLADQVSDALQKGATLLTGGYRLDRPGYYFEPTVLTEVTHDMKVMREESFGPIIGIMKVKNDEEALALMNDTEYGLTAAVYSASEERAVKILTKTDSGTGYWNCCDRVSAALPWSGRRNSGFGVTLSHAGIRAYTRPKALHLKR